MDEQEMAAELDAIAARRVAALRSQMRHSIADALLAQHGEVTLADVQRRFDVEWREPDTAALADQVAAKCAAAVTVARRAVEVEQARRERVAGRIEQQQARLERARGMAEDDRLLNAEAQLALALALAEFAATRGDPASAPPTRRMSVQADAATGEGGT